MPPNTPNLYVLSEDETYVGKILPSEPRALHIRWYKWGWSGQTFTEYVWIPNNLRILTTDELETVRLKPYNRPPGKPPWEKRNA